MNVRTIDALAQVLVGAKLTMRQHHIVSPGQLRELARGECGLLDTFQVGADHKTLFFRCDNGVLTLELADDGKASAALRALLGSTVPMGNDEVRRDLEKTSFTLGADGRPVKIATADRS